MTAMRQLWHRLKNLVVRNDRCCQPRYCRRVSPEDYANPDKCKDCDLPRALQDRVVFTALLGWKHVGPHHALPSRKLGVLETRGPYVGEAMMSPDGRRLCILHPDGRAEFTV